MTIGQLAARTGLSVRTLRFYADSGVLPVVGRTASGYRLFDADAVRLARFVRTLRELGVGLDDIRRVLAAETTLADVAAEHARALDARIRTLRLQRSVLAAVVRTTDPEELERMRDLSSMTADERRRIVDDYLEAVFGADEHAVADKLRMATPELPDDPTVDQVAAWVELAELLRDPDFVAASRRMAERARAEGLVSDPGRVEVGQLQVGKAVGEHAGAASAAGVDPASPEALGVIERIEAVGSGAAAAGDRAAAAERIEAYSDRRVARYWALVGVVNGWPAPQALDPDRLHDAWAWYARALRAHARR